MPSPLVITTFEMVGRLAVLPALFDDLVAPVELLCPQTLPERLQAAWRLVDYPLVYATSQVRQGRLNGDAAQPPPGDRERPLHGLWQTRFHLAGEMHVGAMPRR